MTVPILVHAKPDGPPLYTHYGKVSFFGFVSFSGRKYKAKVNQAGEWYIILSNF